MMMYVLERRGPRYVLAFAAGCALSSAYGFLAGAWPFGILEAIWCVVAIHRYYVSRHPGNASVIVSQRRLSVKRHPSERPGTDGSLGLRSASRARPTLGHRIAARACLGFPAAR